MATFGSCKHILPDQTLCALEVDAVPVDPSFRPSTGDCTTPNNYIELNDANSFVCVQQIVISTKGGNGQKDERVVLPDHVAVRIRVEDDVILYDLNVAVSNPFPTKTAAALLEIPRLPGLIMLEEHHRCGPVEYVPEVMEKERADETFQQAASSTTHSATLSNTTNTFFEVKIDKIPAGTTAEFGITFIQTQVREFSRVMDTADEPSAKIRDIAILVGHTGVNDAGVPMSIVIDYQRSSLHLDRIPPPVLAHEALQLNAITSSLAHGTPCVESLLVFSPQDQPAGDNVLRFDHPLGFACGTLVKARLVRFDEPILDAIAQLSLSDDKGLPGVSSVDVIPRAVFDSRGTPMDLALVEMVVPQVPNPPKQTPHDIYIIMDTSGSTGMRVDTGETFLAKCQEFLKGMLEVLPAHISALRSKSLINSKPIKLEFWSFNHTNTCHAKVELADAPIETLQSKINGKIVPLVCSLQSSGGTNFDAWSSQLQSTVLANPTHLSHVLILTDGGATQQETFERSIRSLSRNASVSFFQCDALGYGPWLNPATVSFLARETEGEAILVQQPSGEQMRAKILGLLARSLVRAARTIHVSVGCPLLAAKSDARSPPLCVVNMLEQGRPHQIEVVPGTRLVLSMLVPSQSSPLSHLAINGHTFAHPAATTSTTTTTTSPSSQLMNVGAGVEVSASLVDWEVVGQRGPVEEQQGILTQAQALRHLQILEPEYTTNTAYPNETALVRDQVKTRVSIEGKVVAPSVTKACALAKLSVPIDPVPLPFQPASRVANNNWPYTVTLDDLCVPPPSWLYDELECKSANLSANAQLFRRSAKSSSMSIGGLFSAVASSLSPRSAAPSPRTVDKSKERKKKSSSTVRMRASPRREAEEGDDDDDNGESAQSTGPPTLQQWICKTHGGLYSTMLTAKLLRVTKTQLIPIFNELMNRAQAAANASKQKQQKQQQGFTDSVLSMIDNISVSSGALSNMKGGDEARDAFAQLRRFAMAACQLVQGQHAVSVNDRRVTDVRALCQIDPIVLANALQIREF
eukprot:c20740_g1_i3.p1 GENE.c20740_g1_i3~~c20740_g1_i3.p1  ORF type:complete len:1032 (+),score=293.00 c20740_g1_i3:48-3143(+)